MKITKKNLLDIIKEEIKNVLEQKREIFDCSALRSSEVDYFYDKESSLMKATITVNGKKYTGIAKIKGYNFNMAQTKAAGRARLVACRDLNSGEK